MNMAWAAVLVIGWLVTGWNPAERHPEDLHWTIQAETAQTLATWLEGIPPLDSNVIFDTLRINEDRADLCFEEKPSRRFCFVLRRPQTAPLSNTDTVSLGLAQLLAGEGFDEERDEPRRKRMSDLLKQREDLSFWMLRTKPGTLSSDKQGQYWKAEIARLLDHGGAAELLLMAEEALQKNPDGIEALKARAASLRRLGQSNEAALAFRDLYQRTGAPEWIVLFSTVVSQNAPQQTDWLLYLRNELEQDPDNPLLQHAVGVLSYYTYDYLTAKRLMDVLSTRLPQDTRLLIYGAMSRYNLGDTQGARQWLAKLEALDNPNGDLWYCKAILNHRENPMQALKDLDRYLATDGCGSL